MVVNIARLKGKIVERGNTQEAVANAIGRRKSTSRAKYRRISARKSTGTLSKIKNRKNYFVRVRAYYKSDNKNYYGDWSSYKKINIK